MASERHCLKIPFLIGQRPDTIIGNSCADNPIWTVPCDDLVLSGVACDPAVLPADANAVLTLPPDSDRTLVLTAPVNVQVPL